MRRLIVISICFVIFVSAVSAANTLATKMSAAGLQAVREGTELLDFELQDLKGNNIKLSSYRGKVVFLNFWATWCPPCRSEMPSMETLYKEYRDRGLEILAVDLQEDRERVEAFFKEYGLTFTALLDTSGKVGAMYGARSIPTTYIIDRKGFIVAGAIGSRDWASPEAKAYIEALLAAE